MAVLVECEACLYAADAVLTMQARLATAAQRCTRQP